VTQSEFADLPDEMTVDLNVKIQGFVVGWASSRSGSGGRRRGDNWAGGCGQLRHDGHHNKNDFSTAKPPGHCTSTIMAP
jgi:hypothetical protein